MDAPPVVTTSRRRAMDLALVGRTARPTRADLALSAVALVTMVTATSVRTGSFHGYGPGTWLVVAALWVPVALRTWAPLPALVVALLGECTYVLVLTVADPRALGDGSMGVYQPVPLATAVITGTLAARSPRRVGWTAGLSAAALLFAVTYLSHTHRLLATDMVTLDLVVLATGIGVAVGARRDRQRALTVEREADVRAAVLEERLRIARELHDVLAHNLTLVNAQAGVAQYLLRTDPAKARAALADITGHTRRAIEELRATVGLLRQDADTHAALQEALRPVPGLDRLEELLTSFTGAGARVACAVTGTPTPLGPHGDLAAYRIVQEALTNATKHAAGKAVDVRLAWSPTGLELTVTNPLPVPGARPAPGTGHGTIGMRERAVAAGGDLAAGRTPSGTYQVHATLPAEAGPDAPGNPRTSAPNPSPQEQP